MTADQRVTSAREYLDGARRRKVTELPPSLLIRECAELRRLLGQLLDVHGQAVSLDEGQAAMVLSALEDAAEWREYQASMTCADCADSPTELCDDHATKLEAANEFRALAREIGGAR